MKGNVIFRPQLRPAKKSKVDRVLRIKVVKKYHFCTFCLEELVKKHLPWFQKEEDLGPLREERKDDGSGFQEHWNNLHIVTFRGVNH